ncbi:MAG: Uncharacterised protein [Methanobacteriota archaeon]|nr:MAG: Uncharacterised protein [Euryarchaeota archaeon]
MPTNHYINHHTSSPEQNLIHDLLIESIKFYGMDVHWLPRISSASADTILGEDTLSSFSTNHTIEMYVKNVEGFEGQGDFLSKFGLDIRDQITFTVSIRRFDQLDSGYERPREGDLIYFPMNKKLFEIQFVEHESMFYPTGTLPVYDLRCELFAYNQQEINTGIEEIDQIAQTIGTTTRSAAFSSNALTSATVSDGDNFAIEERSDSILDFSENNPFGSF